MSNIDTETFPRWTLIASGCLIALTIAGAGFARQNQLSLDAQAVSAPQPAPLSVRDLRFADTAEGAVDITDAKSAQTVHRIEPGAGGFVRSVMRGLVRDRRARGLGEGPAFRLAEWADGRLTLEDLATGKRIELSAFGADNRAAFHQLLRGQQAT